MPGYRMFKPGHCSRGHFQDLKTCAVVKVRSSRSLSLSPSPWMGLPLALNSQCGDTAYFRAACSDQEKMCERSRIDRGWPGRRWYLGRSRGGQSGTFWNGRSGRRWNTAIFACSWNINRHQSAWGGSRRTSVQRVLPFTPDLGTRTCWHRWPSSLHQLSRSHRIKSFFRITNLHVPQLQWQVRLSVDIALCLCFLRDT